MLYSGDLGGRRVEILIEEEHSICHVCGQTYAKPSPSCTRHHFDPENPTTFPPRLPRSRAEAEEWRANGRNRS